MSDNKVRLLIEVPEEFYKILMESSVYIDEVGGVLQDSAKIGTVITDDCISHRVLKGMISDKSIPIQFEKEKRGDWHRSLGMTLGDIYNTILRIFCGGIMSVHSVIRDPTG